MYPQKSAVQKFMGEIVKLIVNIQMRATEQLQDGSNF